LDEVQDGGAIYYGGSVELADYCPYNQCTFHGRVWFSGKWRRSDVENQSFDFTGMIANPSPNSTERRDSRCELDGNFAPNHVNSILEVYGNQSKCFDLATLWTERKCGRIRTFLQYKAGCYQLINGWLREGVIICPPCEELCHPEDFPSSEKFAYCRETKSDEIPEYVGDPAMDEPCAASIPYSSGFNLCSAGNAPFAWDDADVSGSNPASVRAVPSGLVAVCLFSAPELPGSTSATGPQCTDGAAEKLPVYGAAVASSIPGSAIYVESTVSKIRVRGAAQNFWYPTGDAPFAYHDAGVSGSNAAGVRAVPGGLVAVCLFSTPELPGSTSATGPHCTDGAAENLPVYGAAVASSDPN
uniref:LCCL domain-containing protein n=1 Tax=Gongylonema pulchrum TaxID=637853 RepID=A0A183DTW9_9BILA